MIIPSLEGDILLRAEAHAASTSTTHRSTLAFMVMGGAYVTRTMMERLYGADGDGDEDIHIQYSKMGHDEYVDS